MCALLPYTIYICVLGNLWHYDFTLSYRLHSVFFCMGFCCTARRLDNPTLRKVWNNSFNLKQWLHYQQVRAPWCACEGEEQDMPSSQLRRRGHGIEAPVGRQRPTSVGHQSPNQSHVNGLVSKCPRRQLPTQKKIMQETRRRLVNWDEMKEWAERWLQHQAWKWQRSLPRLKVLQWFLWRLTSPRQPGLPRRHRLQKRRCA